jgi:hypothetical protein
VSRYLYLTEAVPTTYRSGGSEDYYGPNAEHDHDYYPWTADGHLIVGRGGYGGYVDNNSLWGVKRFKKIDLRTLIADYYLLDAVASCVLVPGVTPQVAANPVVLLEMIDAGFYARDIESPEGVALEAAIAFSRHVLEYTPIIRDYMHYAMCTEIPYHEVARPLGEGSAEVLLAWKDLIDRFGWETPSRWMIQMFDREGWAGGFGGKAWAGIAIVAHAHATGSWLGEQFGPREFLDRAFSLEHNGGCMFNKVNWACSVSEVQPILDAHANSDWETLHTHSSQSTRDLVAKYLDACGVEDHNKLLGIAPPPPEPETFTDGGGDLVQIHTAYDFKPNGSTYVVNGEINGLSKGAVVVKANGIPFTIQASGPKQTTLVPYNSYYEGTNYNTSYVLKMINSGGWTLFSGTGKQYIVPQEQAEPPVEHPFKAGTQFGAKWNKTKVYTVVEVKANGNFTYEYEAPQGDKILKATQYVSVNEVQSKLDTEEWFIVEPEHPFKPGVQFHTQYAPSTIYTIDKANGNDSFDYTWEDKFGKHNTTGTLGKDETIANLRSGVWVLVEPEPEWNHKVGDYLTAGAEKHVFRITKMQGGVTHAEFVAEGKSPTTFKNGWKIDTAVVHNWINEEGNWGIVPKPDPKPDPEFEKLLQEEEEAIEASNSATVLKADEHPPVKIMGTKFAGSKCKITGKSMDLGDPIVYHGNQNGKSLGASSLDAWVAAFGKVPSDVPNYYKAI